ncbi:hypothetical protein [Nafulsella turpanensis]|uniref:hypothetical protein n=1 Tax=Nafulsella turpanensis TaxID=1265690 RepID=UPI0003484EBF|nr:hypothetical protein [Nafulsella turpanensis]
MKKLLFLFALLAVQGCQTDDCEDYLCNTPPGLFRFNIVDKATGENVFAKGTYSPDQIEVVNTADGGELEFTFVEENGLNLLRIHSIGWQTETVLSSIQLAGEEVFTLFVDAERLSEDCCAFTRYHEVKIEGAEFRLNEEKEIYTILVE